MVALDGICKQFLMIRSRFLGDCFDNTYSIKVSVIACLQKLKVILQSTHPQLQIKKYQEEVVQYAAENQWVEM